MPPIRRTGELADRCAPLLAGGRLVEIDHPAHDTIDALGDASMLGKQECTVTNICAIALLEACIRSPPMPAQRL